MPSTFSSLKIELIATGEQSGTWGVTTNTNLGTAIEEAITGSADVTFTNGNDTTITLTDTNAAQAARNLRLNLVGSSTGAQNLILGSGCQIEKLYLINNTLGHTITVKNTTGTGVAVPAGKKAVVYNDGTNVVNAIDYFATADIAGGTINNTTIGGTTPAAGTFTQVNVTGQGDLRLEDTTGGEYVALQAPGTLASSYTLTLPVDDGTNGQALITDGSGNLSWSTAASGDVYGPASATDNAVVRFDSTTGKLIKNSGVIIDNSNNVTGVADFTNTGNTTLGNASGDTLTITGTTVTTPNGLNFDSNTFVIDATNNRVGVGTASPSVAFDVNGDIDLRATTTEARTIQIGQGRSGNGYALIDFVGDATYTDYGFRIIRNNTGANTDTSLHHRGSGVLGIATLDAGPLTLGTNSSERMRITSTGNVGIGTSNPLTRFDVSNKFRVAPSAASSQEILAGTQVDSYDANFSLLVSPAVPSTNTFQICSYSPTVGWRSMIETSNKASGTPDVILAKSGGNVGIGTSSPAARLDVLGSKNTTIASISASLSTVGGASFVDYSELLFKNTAGSNGDSAIRSYANLWSTSGSALAFFTNSTTALTERMRLDSSGNLGLGVTPSASWGNSIAFQLGNGAAFFSVSGTNNTRVANNALWNGSSWRYIGTDFASMTMQSSGSHYWYTAASGTAGNAITFTQAMTLDASGRLLVGTTTAVADNNLKIQLNAGANQSSVFAVNRQDAYGLLVGYNNITGADYGIITVVPNTPLLFSTNNTERMRISSTGLVGIGKTSMISPLDVADNGNGGVRVTNGTTDLRLLCGASEAFLYCASNTPLVFSTNTTERMRITSGGEVLIGTTASRAYGAFGSGRLQIELASASALQTLISNRNDTGASTLGFGKSRGTTAGSNTAVQSGDPLGTVNWSGADGTGLITAASIASAVDASVSTNIVPGRLIFNTANTSGVNVERMRLDSSGNLGLGVTPSASTVRAFQVPNSTVIGSQGEGLNITTNAFFDSSWKRHITGAAAWYQQATGQHAWWTAGSAAAGSAITFTQAMTLDASGNLGIGTTSTNPLSFTQNLAINGSGSTALTIMSGGTSRGYFSYDAGTTAMKLASFTSIPLVFATSDTERMRITSTGGIRVGSSTNPSGSSVLLSLVGAPSGGASSSMQFTYNGGTYGGSLIGSGSQGGGMEFYTFTGNVGSESYTERMRITSGGDVGIGTSTPPTYGAGFTVFQVNNTSSGIVQANNSGSSITTEIESEGTRGGIGTRTNHPLAFKTNQTERMRITSGGDVGIGVTPNNNKLVVKGAHSSGRSIMAVQTDQSATGSPVFVGFYNSSDTRIGYVGCQTATDMQLWAAENVPMLFGTNNTERMRITSDGRLLIRTTTGTGNEVLAVWFNSGGGVTTTQGINLLDQNASANGAAYIIFRKSDEGNIGSITRNTNTNAVLYNTTSDYRLKENVAPLTGALEKVAKLKPVTWKWKDLNANGEGFIAHEVQEVVPSAVSGEKDAVDENGKPAYQGMDASYLVATLTAAIQEQQAMIEELKQEVAKLKGV